jgi:FHA domain
MSQRLSSFFILLGIALVVLALWYLSYLAVRWDTRRRGVRPIERKMWIAAAVALPLFGFSLYLFMRILRRYLTPEEIPADGSTTEIYVRAYGLGSEEGTASSKQEQQPAPMYALRQVPMPEPAWGNTDPAHSNGKAHAYQTPETIHAQYQPLRVRYSLLVIQGPLTGQQFVLDTLPALVGRGQEVGVPLDADLNVSRKHAEIYEWNGMLRIRDLGSMHGTQINGVTVNDQALSPGDRITMGGTILILRELP